MRRAGAEARPKHRSSGSGNRRRGKSIWTSRLNSTKLKFFTSLNKRSFLLDRERPVFFSLAREKKMGGSNLDQPLQMADLRSRREARPPKGDPLISSRLRWLFVRGPLSKELSLSVRRRT